MSLSLTSREWGRRVLSAVSAGARIPAAVDPHPWRLGIAADGASPSSRPARPPPPHASAGRLGRAVRTLREPSEGFLVCPQAAWGSVRPLR